MKKIKHYILLSREAMLFDSPLYIIKSFLAVMTAYLLFSKHSIIGKDMISLLFGMMLTLEPVNVSGLKSGLAQVKASWLGGVTTAIVVAVFGINWVTIPFAVAVTIYISLIGNWKEISPVAIFTAIYMTQYVQFDSAGSPSVLLTLRLRLLALTAGILIAVFYNYIFSRFFYKKMMHKRLTYVLEKMLFFLKAYKREKGYEGLNQIKNEAMILFKDIDFIFNHISEKALGYDNQVFLMTEIKNLNHYIIEMILFTLNTDLEKLDVDHVIIAYDRLMDTHENLLKTDQNGNINTRDLGINKEYYIKIQIKTIQNIESAIKNSAIVK